MANLKLAGFMAAVFLALSVSAAAQQMGNQSDSQTQLRMQANCNISESGAMVCVFQPTGEQTRQHMMQMHQMMNQSMMDGQMGPPGDGMMNQSEEENGGLFG